MKHIKIYLNNETKEDIKKAAKKAKMSESTWGRQALLDKLEKEAKR
jgi:hypothetical protein